MIFFYSALIETEEQRAKFECIYEKYYGLMYHVALSITGNHQLAEDAVHETCLRIIDQIDDIRIDSGKQLVSYLSAVTRGRTIDYLRKWCREKNDASDGAAEYTQAETGPEEIVLSALSLEQAVQQLSRMPEKYRGPLILKTRGYSIQEIARFLELPDGTVKTRIFRARQMLRQSLKE